MKVAVVGGGGREHAIIKKIKENATITEVFAFPGNGGISFDATCIDIKATAVDEIVTFCVMNKIEYVVVAPDDPLVLGLVDKLANVNIPAFGPSKAAAEIEGSKVFSKNLMKKYNIPTAEYASFDDLAKAEKYIEKQTTFPLVVKADGLALGKGVFICMDKDESLAAVRAMMRDDAFGKAGNSVVIEECLIGPEVSVLCFTDGNTLVPMVSSMDHKRALDNDEGLNTGGMGAIAPNPFYTEEIAKVCMDKIFMPTINAMKEEGRIFKGCLYFGLMLTTMGPKVIEYNCRFGDPETQVVLPLLKTDLFTIMQAVTQGRLDSTKIEFENKFAACVVIASGGYPKSYEKNIRINGLVSGSLIGTQNTVIYHSGTRLLGRELLTNGGRVLGVSAVGDTLKQAVDTAYEGVHRISFDGGHFRKDIGKKCIK